MKDERSENMEIKNKALRYILELDVVISGISLVTLIIATFFGVIMRYFFNNPFTWLEEFQLWSFTWLVFFGAGAAFRTGSHVAIEILVDLMPNAMKRVVEVFGYFVTMGVLAYFIIHGSALVNQLMSTGRVTNILKVPYPVIYSALPIGCGLMMVNYTLITFISLFGDKTQAEGGVK